METKTKEQRITLHETVVNKSALNKGRITLSKDNHEMIYSIIGFVEKGKGNGKDISIIIDNIMYPFGARISHADRESLDGREVLQIGFKQEVKNKLQEIFATSKQFFERSERDKKPAPQNILRIRATEDNSVFQIEYELDKSN